MALESETSTFTKEYFDKFFEQNHFLFPEDEKSSQSDGLLMKRKKGAKIFEEFQMHQKELESSQRALQRCKSKLKENEERRRQRLQYNTLLKLNKEQQRNVEKKGCRNTALMKKKQEHLQELKEELDSVIVQQQQLKHLNEENCVHYKFLADVLKEYKKFQEPDELIFHFKTRDWLRQELLTSTKQKKVVLEKSLAHMEWVRMQYHFERLSTMTEVNTKEGELETVKNEEAMWNQVMQLAQMKNQQQSEICLATRCIPKHMLETGIGVSREVKTENVTELLDEIQEFMCDLNLIWEKVTKPEPSVSGTNIDVESILSFSSSISKINH